MLPYHLVLYSSFILTMWYVNILHSISLAFNNLSFILTMWYVNFYCEM